MFVRKRLVCVILCVILILSSALSVSALEQKDIYYILNTERFLEFAENCRLDSYSEDLTVMLCRDIDLSGTGFTGIPIFNGIFEGNGHTIAGLQLDAEGSITGLFRYLTETAIVRDLRIMGYVTPDGTANTAGALAGNNAGTIENCSFEGKVTANDNVGGLVGINQLTGIISQCNVSGIVNGHHFVGGIAGNNYGVIKNCENHSLVNTTIEQNDVDLEDITLDSILNSESAVNVTDIGGICGTGSGVIRDCKNYGSIGYPQMGFNVGGIAGSWSGYLYRCENHGSVDGRKEVGGIAGQLEPAVSILYEEDTLQTLQQQMDTMSGLTSGAGAHIQSGSNALGAQGQNIEKQMEEAQKALDILIPDEDDPTPPDPDSILAAQNALSSSFSEINSSLNSIIAISENTLTTLNQDIQGISNQMNAISGTIGNASENLGGRIADVSDADTDNDVTAKIRLCNNLGNVNGDWNVGGIAGAIALENDLDPESDLMLVGNSSLNYDLQLRSVITECKNQGTVYGKKQNIGGIAGLVSMGLVKQCVNTASIEAAAADYTGGIAGSSIGRIRQCSVKCAISGETYTGGIAGTATTVTDCLSMILLEEHGEKAGAVLGDSDYSELQNNYYLPLGNDPGAIDGISYAAQAEPLSERKFFQQDSLPDDFRNVAVTFQYDEDTSHRRIVPFGTTMTEKMLPAIPREHGRDAVWVGDVQPGEPILFNATFTIVKPGYLQTLESDLKASDTLPVLLAQGQFSPDAVFTARAQDDSGALASYLLEIPNSKSSVKLRCILPTGTSADRILLLVQTDSGWRETEFSVSGSYLVFDAPENIRALRIKEIPVDYSPYILGGSAVAALTVLTVATSLILRRKKRKKS